MDCSVQVSTDQSTQQERRRSRGYFRERQRSEQNLTLSQSRAHFFLHVNGRPQLAHGFSGRFDLAGFTPFAVTLVRCDMRVHNLHTVAARRLERPPLAVCDKACP
jgi:hypothetical protein